MEIGLELIWGKIFSYIILDRRGKGDWLVLFQYWVVIVIVVSIIFLKEDREIVIFKIIFIQENDILIFLKFCFFLNIIYIFREERRFKQDE